MFGALRWRLTAWYVSAFAAVFVVIALTVFFIVRAEFASEIDDTVRDVSDASVAAMSPKGATPDITDGARIEALQAILAEQSLGRSADVFVLLLDTDGAIIANPRDVSAEGLPDFSALEHARRAGADWRTIELSGQGLRVRTVGVRGADGSLLGYIQAGKSLEERDQSLSTLLTVIFIGGAVGLALAGVGGSMLADVAIRPVRRSFERQQEFVLDASHELRTPIAVIRSSAESLASGSVDPDAVQDIAEESRYVTRLLDDLLLLASQDRGQIIIETCPTDLAAVVRSAASAAQVLARDAGLSFSLECDGPIIVDGDAERLREALLVLLDNAVRYTPHGGSVTMRAAVERHSAVVAVSDTGVGVPREHLPHLFDRFYRVDKTRSRAQRAVGIGLSIAREIVVAHRGSIALESKEGEGTTVKVRLPLAAPNGSG